jgi:hypothetical protein
MISRVNFNEFCDGLEKGSGFSYEGKLVLFDYLESLEEDTGEHIEFDAVAIRCEFSEATLDELIEQYSDLAELCPEFNQEEPSIKEWEAMHNTAKEFLENNTILCGVTKDGGYVFQEF